MRSNKEVESSVIRQRLHLAAANVHIKAAKLARLLKANFNPNQPRVPRGNPDGGQWTRVDGSEGPLSDAAADIARTGQQYAATNITIDPNALTGISNIDETTVALTRTLATVVDGLGVIAGMGAARYGTLVHTLFGTAVRLANFRGIGFFDVETTFSLEPDA